MLPDLVSNPGSLTYESDALPIALRGPAHLFPYSELLWYFFYVKYKLTESSGATKSMCSSQMKCYFKVPFKRKDLHRYLTFLPQWTLDQMTGRQ